MFSTSIIGGVLCYMMIKNPWFSLFLLGVLAGCETSGEIQVDDLNTEKHKFIDRVFEGNLDDGPFLLDYSLKSVFLSGDIISLFGEFTRYTAFPHDTKRYEGKTFCRVNGKFQLVSLHDLFKTAEQKEFLRKFCEDILKGGPVGYFDGDPPLLEHLDPEKLEVFLIHEHFLVIVFQRYAVAGLEDYPTTIKIPYTTLKGHINPDHPLIPLLEKTVSSKSFVSSWESILGSESGH